ncbi:MAG TPA: ABC transporter substrate-binding protein [Acidobacteriota bacterium]|nr:ABC transporter substrate-binding protein [Acidobacteriota bacterium]
MVGRRGLLQDRMLAQAATYANCWWRPGRRRLIHLFCLSGLSVFCACTEPRPTEAPSPSPDLTNLSQTPEIPYEEAPELARAVEKGELLPVKERLPRVPMILQPEEQIGRYGGSLRVAIRNLWEDNALVYRVIGYENLVRWDPQWNRVIPNLAASYEEVDPNREWIFHLREGVRWSDGVPFTSADIVFAAENVLIRSDLPARPWVLWERLTPAVTAEGPHRVRIRLAQPYSLFLEQLAGPMSFYFTSYPRHVYAPLLEWLRQNPRVTADRRDSRRERAVPFREESLLRGLNAFVVPDVPTLAAWVLERGDEQDPSRLSARRNPYYWKVDTAGRQLPYLDRVEFLIVPDVEEIRRRAVAGELDFQPFYLASPGFKPAWLSSGADRMTTFTLLPSSSNVCAICLNLVHEDPVLRGIFSDVRFRIALSLGLDRRAIIRNVFPESLEPYQVAPRPLTLFYHDRLARQWTQYDPRQAKAILERLGLGLDLTTGVRRRPDGGSLAFTLAYTASADFGEVWLPLAEQVAAYWRALGIDVRTIRLPAIEFRILKATNRHDAVIWSGDGGVDVLLDPRFYFPYSNESNFAVTWARSWLAGSEIGEEVPPAVRRQWELYEQILSISDSRERAELMSNILDIAADQFWCMGIALTPPSFGLVHRGLGNVPSLIPQAWTYPTPAPTNLCQFFWTSFTEEELP